MIPQAALTCLLYERDQAQARVDELEERLEEAHGTIRDGFAEVEASKPDYSRNRNTSLTTETRQSGGEFGAAGPVRGAASRPQGLLMANNVSVGLGNRSSADRVDDERFVDCRALPLIGLYFQAGDHRGSTGGTIRNENMMICLCPGQAEARLEGLKESIPEEVKEVTSKHEMK